MASFHEKLERWFIEMGYPLDEAESTDWQTLCNGRLREYWNSVMATTKPKRHVDNVLRNAALQNLKNFAQYQNCSATEIGTIVLPQQIYIPRERKKMQQKLDMTNVDISSKTNTLKNMLIERKQKCVDLQNTKKEIERTDRIIHMTKAAISKMKQEVYKYRNATALINSFKNKFTNDSVFNQDKEKRSSDDKIFGPKDHFNDPIEDDSPLKNILNIPEAKVSELCTRSSEFYKYFPIAVEEDLLKLKEKYAHKINGMSSNECNVSMKSGLTQLQIFHCRVVIATVQMKKQIRQAKIVSSVAKSKVLNKISSDPIKLDTFSNQCSRINANAYNQAFNSEINDLREHSGFYRQLCDSFSSSKNVKIFDGIKSVKDNISEIRQKTIKKLKDMKIDSKNTVEINQRMKLNLCESKNNRVDKVLWKPEYENLQNKYLNIILTNSSSLKITSENPFSSFSYLKILIREISENEKLKRNMESISDEREWWEKVLKIDKKDVSVLQNCSNDGLDDIFSLHNDHLLKLYPLQNILFVFVKNMRLKHALESIKYTDSHDRMCIEEILGKYTRENLNDLEQRSIMEIMKYLKKYPCMSKLDVVIADTDETYNFFNDFHKQIL